MTLGGCNTFKMSWVDENSRKVPKKSESILPFDMGPLGGHFDDKGIWHPDDPTIEATYKIPDLSSGLLFDTKSFQVTPTIQVEILEYDAPWKKSKQFWRYLSVFKLDVGAGYQRAFGYLGIRITSIFEVSVGVAVGWNFEEKDYFVGPALTIIKF